MSIHKKPPEHKSRAVTLYKPKAKRQVVVPFKSRLIETDEIDFDVIAEMEENKDSYISTGRDDSAYLSMTIFPDICRNNIDRLRARVSYQPGIHPTIACCLDYGVQLIADSPELRDFLEVRHKVFNARADLDPELNRIIHSFVNKCEVIIPSGRRQNARVPQHIHIRLADLSSKSGVELQKLAVICIMYTLVIQPDANEGDRETIKPLLESFERSINIRHGCAVAIMERFGI